MSRGLVAAADLAAPVLSVRRVAVATCVSEAVTSSPSSNAQEAPRRASARQVDRDAAQAEMDHSAEGVEVAEPKPRRWMGRIWR
jgi:hypothetical protein